MSIQRCCQPVHDGDFSEAARLFKALGDPHRLTILATLACAEDDVCVCDFTDGLPLNQPTVSHHLRVLREVGAVTSERRGTWVYYRLNAALKEQLTALLHTLIPEKALA